MAKTAKGVAPPDKTRPTILVNSALWVEFRKWAKGQGKTLPKAVEDALRGAMIKQQAEICTAGDGKEREDLTALDGEPENRSECDRCATEINTDNEGVIVDGSLLCAKCHADDQLPRCSGCGETGELSPDGSGDLVCEDCLRSDEAGLTVEHITSCVRCSAVVDLDVAGSGEIIPDVGVMCERCLDKEDGEPEICAGCGKQHSTCGRKLGCQDCDGFEK